MRGPGTRTLTAASLLLAIVLPGCATLSEGECVTADWYQLGQQDGRQGYKRSRLYDHRQACAEYGVRPDHDAYYAGREVGLAYYCTPDNGYRVGRNGLNYGGVCPAKYEAGFLAEYRKGETIHEVDEEVEEIESDIRFKEARLDDDDTGDEEADELREDLRDLYRELRYRNRELVRLERLYGR